MGSSRRDLFNDMAEHRSILKNYQNTYYPRFSFTPKTGLELPETSVSFLLRALYRFNIPWLDGNFYECASLRLIHVLL